MAHELACDLLGNVLDIDLSNLNANFHATLDAFVICEKGQSYRKTLFYRREPGI